MSKWRTVNWTSGATGETTPIEVRGSEDYASAQIQNLTNNQNYELAKAQNDWNVDQWNRENEYNSPANQIKLLQEAGLNPNLYKGDSTASSLTSANMSNSQSPTLSTSAQSQANTISSVQTGLQALKTSAEAAGYLTDIQRNQLEMSQMQAMFPNQLESGRIGNEVQDALRRWYEAQEKGQHYDNRVSRVTVPQRIESASLQNEISRGNILMMSTQARQIEQSMSNDITRLGLEKKMNAQTLLNMRQDILESISRSRLNDSQSSLNEWNANFMYKYGFSPNSPIVSQLTQLAVSDTKQFDAVFNSLIDKFDYAKGRLGLTGSRSWLNPFGSKSFFSGGFGSW